MFVVVLVVEVVVVVTFVAIGAMAVVEYPPIQFPTELPNRGNILI